MEPNQVDLLALAMFRNFEEVEDPEEAGRKCELWGDIREADPFYRIHLDVALFHAIPTAHLDVRTHPDSHAARNFSATNALAQTFGEGHPEIVHAGTILEW